MQLLTKQQIYATPYYKQSLENSIYLSNNINGKDDPNFKRIHHHNHHLVACIKELMGTNCKTYCEIGTHFGHSLCNVLSSQYPTKFITIDLFSSKGIAADCQIKNVYALACSNAFQFNTYNYEIHILKGNSTSDEIINQVKDITKTGIDLLFIDGDHRYDGVIQDFENFFPLVNSKGIIIFDDYLPYKVNNKDRECPKAVNYLVNKYKKDIHVIGLLDDKIGANKIKNNNSKLNIDFIIQKL